MQIKLASDLMYDSIVDGLGLRIVVWTQGCAHNCFKCHNPQTHDFEKGKYYNIDELVDKIVKYPLKSGVTLSGGDPFFQKEETLYLVKKLKENKINIWAYTGFIYEDLIKDQIWLETLKHIDVLIDGPFIFKEYDPLLKFRGSKNQRIIDVKQSLENNQIIEVQL